MFLDIYRRAGAIFLSLSLIFLAGCSSANGEKANGEATEDSAYETPETVLPVSDGMFGIGYVSSEGINPFTVSGSTNQSLGGLIYNSLFVVDETFGASPGLCEDYRADGTFTEYKLKIKSGVKFSDGTDLTLSDVIYSLSSAKNSVVYGERLSIIEELSEALDSEGQAIANTLVVTLNEAHSDLPVLLNTPVIKHGSAEQPAPVGTGPYKFSDTDISPRLIKNEYYWGDNVPADEIYLIETEDTAQAFADGIIDLVNIDFTSSGLSLEGDKDIRDYNTSVMEYIGFNMHTMKDARVRNAISYAIDREDIIQTCLNSSCTPSVLPLHPSSEYYDADLTQNYVYNMDMAAQLLDRGRNKDRETESDSTDAEYEQISESPGTSDEGSAGDSGEERPVFNMETYEKGGEQEVWLQLDLLVCSDSTARCESAQMIADNLKRLGIEVTVVGKTYSEYVDALESGSFDLYYGQVKLKSDFDLSQLITHSGSLNYGNVSDDKYADLISEFLSMGGDKKKVAADAMCKYILNNNPIAVIGFKKMSVVTRQGIVTGMNSHQDNIFANITEWLIEV